MILFVEDSIFAVINTFEISASSPLNLPPLNNGEIIVVVPLIDTASSEFAVIKPSISALAPLNLPPLNNGEIIVVVPLIIGAEK